jgi:hypothetical protein
MPARMPADQDSMSELSRAKRKRVGKVCALRTRDGRWRCTCPKSGPAEVPAAGQTSRGEGRSVVLLLEATCDGKGLAAV